MKILVTGCAGMYGSHISEALCNDGHEVFGCDNMSIGYSENIISHPNFTFFKQDVTDFDSLKLSFPKNVDVVYHCACIPYESFSPWCPSQITKSIVCGTTNVATLAIQNNVKRFINFSSTGRYGSNDVPYREEMIPVPRDPYSVAKVSAENLLRNLSEIHNLEFINAIPHNCQGPRAVYTSPYRNVLMIWVNSMLQNKSVYIYGNGDTVRCFSFVQDQIDLLKKFVDCDLEKNGENFNIGGDDNRISLNELFKTTAKVLKYEKEPIYIKGHKQEVKIAFCSSDKIRNRFGYKNEMSIEDGVLSIADYIKTRGTKNFEYKMELEIINEETPETWKNKLI